MMEQITPDDIQRAFGEADGPVQDETLRRLVHTVAPVVQKEVAALLVIRAAAERRDARQELEDLVQEVISAMMARRGALLRRWSPERGLGFRGFVAMVGRQQAAMVLRSSRRSPWTELPYESEALERALNPEPPHQHERVEARERLRFLFDQLRDRLDARGHQLFELLYLLERDVDEVCEELGMSRDAVYLWRRRFRQLVAKLALGSGAAPEEVSG